ncbi:hypothetical protein NMY22_g2992 [Coprinellus aureogranulatus]|nr:hypothetical protein NMY22_g2992 [Coprinellus aureogranulatus]
MDVTATDFFDPALARAYGGTESGIPHSSTTSTSTSSATSSTSTLSTSTAQLLPNSAASSTSDSPPSASTPTDGLFGNGACLRNGGSSAYILGLLFAVACLVAIQA